MHLKIFKMCKDITWAKYNTKFWGKKSHSVQNNTGKGHTKSELPASKELNIP